VPANSNCRSRLAASAPRFAKISSFSIFLDRIEPEPGFGMVTIYIHETRDPDAPDALVIPIGTIRRIELRSAPDERVARFGFVVPS